jgi:hypothetical protein
VSAPDQIEQPRLPRACDGTRRGAAVTQLGGRGSDPSNRMVGAPVKGLQVTQTIRTHTGTPHGGGHPKGHKQAGAHAHNNGEVA